MNLLLAEDDVVARMTLSAVLKGLGYEVTEAEHGGKKRYLEGMEAGADDFITKPVDMDELRARLKAAERMVGLRHHVQRLEGLLPMCAYCKRIRDVADQWHSIKSYVEARSDAQFSHGYCPNATKACATAD